MIARRDAVLAGGASIAAAFLSACNAESGAHAQAHPTSAQSARPSEYDRGAIVRILAAPATHKQVFESEVLAARRTYAPIFVKMQNSLNAFEFSLGMGPLTPLGVLTGTSALLALSDAMWTKYGIGSAYGVDDAVGNAARTNIFQAARSPLALTGDPADLTSIYHDFSGAAVVRRGAKFFVCNVALTGIAAKLAALHQVAASAVLAELQHNLVPEHYLVPAGVAAVQLAQERGWRLYVV